MIGLASETTRLLIHPANDSSTTISEDRSCILFTPNASKTRKHVQINAVELRLIDSEKKVIVDIDVPIRSRGRRSSVRIDALYSMIFDSGENVGLMDEVAFRLLPSIKNSYELFVELTFGRLPYFAPSLAEIKSTSLIVQRRMIPVSREVMAVNCEFFLGLFYGNFAENTSGSYRINDVEYNNLLVFINMVHRSEDWFIGSIADANNMALLADRFRASYPLKIIIVYLKNAKFNRFSKDFLSNMRSMMRVAARFPQHPEFATGLQASAKSPRDSLIMMEAYVDELQNPVMMQFLKHHRVLEEEELDDSESSEDDDIPAIAKRPRVVNID